MFYRIVSYRVCFLSVSDDWCCCALFRRSWDIGVTKKRKDSRLCQNGSNIYCPNDANTMPS